MTWIVASLCFITLITYHHVRHIAAEDPQAEEPYYKPPKPIGAVHFVEPFLTHSALNQRWVLSKAKKNDVEEELSKYDGEWELDSASENSLRGDIGLVLKDKAKHSAISTKLDKPFVFGFKPLVVQYEVKFQNPMECGGAYIKLLTEESGLVLDNFNDKTPYTIMFGPDKCGNDAKLHFIFRHKNPKNGSIEEKHSKKAVVDLGPFFSDKKSHLYTLVVNLDNTFQVYIDQNKVNSGNLLEDFTPPVNPPEYVDDPEDKKPADWDDREKIPDPEAKKPDDWDEDAPAEIEDVNAVKPSDWLDDEEELVPDPEASKPDDWDDEMDGEWEAPLIKNPACESVSGCGEWVRPKIENPAYKGKWRASLIDNPDYKGEWAPKKIKNPDWFHDPEPYKMMTIGALGLELWSMTDGVIFDNFLITDEKFVADKYAEDSWSLKNVKERAAIEGEGLVASVISYTNERPWLWAVYLVAIILPIVLIVTYCCSSSAAKDGDKHPKKTDALQPDDIPEEEEEEEDEEGEDENSEKKEKKSKGQLEEPVANNVDEAAGEDDNDDDNDDNDVNNEDEEPVKSSPRKRKPRVD